ncbi:helix-turn-helix transcriptional regulator [Gordonibacter sp.]|uniref:helix-turn-helix transcriptional regulator n=1 Tax=Gordonibacter sp. TaxID=1968902 RepID=UPI0025B8D5AC|nr:helix-turn-helix transcriptional regulator [Gordonibacter sp.]
MVTSLFNHWPSSDAVLGAVGSGTAVVFNYVVFFGRIFTFYDGGSALLQAAGPAVGVVCQVLTYAALYIFSDKVSRIDYRIFVLLAVCLMCASLIGAFFFSDMFVSPVFDFLLYACFGIGLALQLVGWTDYSWCVRGPELIVVALLFFCAIAFELLLHSSADAHSRVLICIASTFFMALAFISSRQNGETHIFISKSESNESVNLNYGSLFSYATTGFAIALVAVLLCEYTSIGLMLFMFASAALAVAITGAVVVCLGYGRFLLQGPIERVTFPELIAFLLISLFFDGYVRLALVWFVVFLLLLRDLARIVNLYVLGSEFGIQTLNLSLKVSLPLALGFLFGLLIPALFPQLYMVNVVILVCALCFAIAIVPYGSDALTMPDTKPEKAATGDSEKGCWKKACDQMSEEAHLTPREREVFLLLSHGRSSLVISRELHVAVTTVKTHTSNIYRKFDVTTQQDLIDLLDDRRVQIGKENSEPKQRL